MQIEYTIKLQKDGFAITESIKTGDTAAPVKPNAPVVQNSLGANFQDSTAAAAGTAATGGGQSNRPVGGGQSNRPPGGGQIADSGGPITIIGPFIMLCRPDDPEETHE
ncbi:MAG TPA: hypothetical protein VHZ55_14245 [Bryobacteraceae bacterium]|jgi:hypothetical protein|nr:hypothetical protein [Bryobacteraceae bacterium]